MKTKNLKKLLSIITAAALAISVMAFAPLMASANSSEGNVHTITSNATIAEGGLSFENGGSLGAIGEDFTINVQGSDSAIVELMFIEKLIYSGEINLSGRGKVSSGTNFTFNQTRAGTDFEATIELKSGTGYWNNGAKVEKITLSGTGTVEITGGNGYGGADLFSTDLVIESGNITFVTSKAFKSVLIEEGATLTWGEGAGTLNIAQNEAITNNGTFIINSEFETNNGLIINNGEMINNANRTLSNSGGIENKGDFTNEGTINNYSNITNTTGTFTNDGTITESGSSSRIILTDGAFINNDTINANPGAKIELNGGIFTNAVNGVITEASNSMSPPVDMSVNNDAQLVNRGEISTGGNSSIEVNDDGMFTNHGTFNVLSLGRLVINDDGKLINSANGTISVAGSNSSQRGNLNSNDNATIENAGEININGIMRLSGTSKLTNTGAGGEINVLSNATLDGEIQIAENAKIVHKGKHIKVAEGGSITGDGIIERWDGAKIDDEYEGIEVDIVNMRTPANNEPEQTAPAAGGSPVANIISGGGIGGGSGGGGGESGGSGGGGRETEVITDKERAAKAVSETSRGTVTLSPSIGATADALQALAVANSNVKVWIPHGNHGVAIKGADINGGEALKDLNFAGGLTTVSEGLAARFPQASAVTGMRFVENGDFGAVEAVTLSVKLNIDPKLWGSTVAVYSVNPDGSLTRLAASRIVSGNGLVNVTISNYNSLVFVVG
ncbi:MAG: hypothetical protein FWG90_01645 [Oscillospiraceae bacterium]|nr:hypothetical protein [Oscillospiraceae bacterium]